MATEGRLLTMTGTGGCGMTHLALALAANLLNEFDEGVWLVELAPLEDPALLPQLILSTVGLGERSGEPLVQTLVTWIGARHLLIVLDNCEHLIDRCVQIVERLLDDCSNLRIVATSREPLRVAGELAWRVPSLAVPDSHAPRGELLESPAARRHFEDGLSVARRQDSPVWVGFALDGLGWTASRQGRLKESQSHLIASLDLRREVGATATMAESLDGVAGVPALSGHALRGCRLAGAAEAQRQRVGQTLVPARRQMRDNWMIGVRHDLGEQAAEAFSAGTQLSLDEAIALAHEGDEPVAATLSHGSR